MLISWAGTCRAIFPYPSWWVPGRSAFASATWSAGPTPGAQWKTWSICAAVSPRAPWRVMARAVETE